MSKVMICEDSAVQALDLMEAVEAAGHEVCGCFANSQDAVRAMSSLKPDIAIVDLTLDDGFTGERLAVRLAATGCAIIVLSGLNDVSVPLSRLHHVRVAKPVDPGLVRRLLETLKPVHEGYPGPEAPPLAVAATTI